MESIKEIEKQSSLLKDVYITNRSLVKDIENEQKDVITQLNGIEKELDILISDDYYVGQDEDILAFYSDPLSSVFTQTSNDYQPRIFRQQIFQKAFAIEQYADEIARELINSQKAIQQTQIQNQSGKG